MRTNPFDRKDGTFVVARNSRGQYSLWPSDLDVPRGWTADRPARSRDQALADIERLWSDIRDLAGPVRPLPTLPELFAIVAASYAGQPAVESATEVATYGELAVRVNQLARELIARGLGPGDLVGLSVPRGVTLAVAALAVSTCGAAYVPLDPAYPAERIEHMLTDSGATVLLHSGKHRPVRAGAHDEVVVLDLDDPATSDAVAARPGDAVRQAERRRPLAADALMYLIYTSGSTGVPKGVAVPHAGMEGLVATQRQWIGAGPGDRVLQWASFNFDAGFWDLTLALLSGATLVLTDEQAVLPGEELRSTLIERRVTHAVLPPVALSVTDPTGVLPGGVLLSTGDSCPASLVRTWAPGRRMFNGYGPTEMTVGVTMAGPIEPGADVSIGVPWPGNAVRVLDERLGLCGPGEEGELFLVGAGEALGYLNRPGLTAERFVANPYGEPGARMYRSGDVGYRSETGELYFTGRADHQVKLRGFRVELGEIEAALDACDEVALSAAVVTGSLDGARLVAFVAPSKDVGGGPHPALTGEALRRRLGERLPSHAVPTAIVVLDTLPVTSNGKVDRAALERKAAELGMPAEQEAGAVSAADSGADPSIDPVGALCALAARVLGVPTVEPHDNFFDRGGHSVLAVKLARSVRDDWGMTLPVRAIFERSTMAELSDGLKAS